MQGNNTHSLGYFLMLLLLEIFSNLNPHLSNLYIGAKTEDFEYDV
ncbi:MAG: hypothetical protein K0S93_1595 [Nitrososphaeraceae archaeon]|jgi:hypothetical protein|nr:hypothetical protein [Nitrososphaeraceae archaeon]